MTLVLQHTLLQARVQLWTSHDLSTAELNESALGERRPTTRSLYRVEVGAVVSSSVAYAFTAAQLLSYHK